MPVVITKIGASVITSVHRDQENRLRDHRDRRIVIGAMAEA
jgi:hypothetical protein